MYKKACVSAVLFVLIAQTQSINVMEGSNTKFQIVQRVIDDQVKIPQPFEKIGVKYYYISENETVNWFGAAQKCRQLQGNLINLQNKLELYNVGLRLNSSLEYWTDLNNLVNSTIFYSLTTGTKANMSNMLNDGNDTQYINMCGVLKFDKSTSNFMLVKQNCVRKRTYFVCETNVPTTISFIVY